MNLTILQTLEVIETMENYLESIRFKEFNGDIIDIEFNRIIDYICPEEFMDKRVIYHLEDNNVIIYQNHRQFQFPIAKTTYVKSKDFWKVYWMNDDIKWLPYTPKTVKTFQEFVELVKNDEMGYFWR